MLPTVTLIGIVKFKEMKTIPSGKQVCSMMVSCSEKDRNGDWINFNAKCSFWEKAAEFTDKFFNDGSVIAVTGRLYERAWTDKNGNERKSNELLFPQASFVPRDRADSQQQSASSEPSKAMVGDYVESDIPF